jgi:hypothetical protein
VSFVNSFFIKFHLPGYAPGNSADILFDWKHKRASFVVVVKQVIDIAGRAFTLSKMWELPAKAIRRQATMLLSCALWRAAWCQFHTFRFISCFLWLH